MIKTSKELMEILESKKNVDTSTLEKLTNAIKAYESTEGLFTNIDIVADATDASEHWYGSAYNNIDMLLDKMYGQIMGELNKL